jgi:hypothetical protein
VASVGSVCVDPCLLFDVSGRVFFVLGSVFGFRSGFSGWIRFWVKNHGPYQFHELLRVKNYGLYPPVALLIGSGWVEYFLDGSG